MDIVIVSVFSFFLLLTIWVLLAKNFFSTPTLLIENENTNAQFEEYAWGSAWVYDNDRARKSTLTPILFIHGLGGSLYSWRYQLQEFEKDHPIIAIDLLGFGKSSKPENQSYGLDGHSKRILDILEAKKITTCYTVGCSLGGALALWLTSQHPERFRNALVISPAAVATVVPFSQLSYEALGGFGQRLISRPFIQLALQRGLVHHHKITDEIIENYFAPFKERGAMPCFFKTISAIKDIRTYQSLKKIKSPVLILYGHGDRTISHRVIQRIKEANSLFEVIEHSIGGHHLMEDEPEWVNEKILTFFQIKKTFFYSTEV